MEPENSLRYFKDHATCSHPEQDQSSPHPVVLYLRFIVVLSLHLNLGPLYDRFQVFRPNPDTRFSSVPCVLQAHPIESSLI